MTRQPGGYRSAFASPSQAAGYDSGQYAPHSWSSLLWELEQAVLDEVLDEPGLVPNREAYLDFACGTGRVTRHLAPRFTATWGLDVSPAMVARARASAPRVRFVVGDVEQDPGLLPAGAFDLITAFRFLLNVDDDTRLPALRWMRERLRGPDGRILLNNHGNLASHKALAAGGRRLAGRAGGVTGNVLSHRRVVALVEAAGLQVVRVTGRGLLGGRICGLLPFDRALRLQRELARATVLQRFAEDQIYLLRPATGVGAPPTGTRSVRRAGLPRGRRESAGGG